MTLAPARGRPLAGLRFDNAYARLPDAFFARVEPTPIAGARLLHFNDQAAALLDLDPEEAARADAVEYLAGARPLPGAEPVAQRYAGHQFGQYVPELGDDRAILLGEVVNDAGERWDLHLKGAGRTPFSRGFDGRSVLRSAVREYLCGEALHALRIPTTRALCLVSGTEPVQRETVERAASLIRLAPTHVRFGTFESFAWRREPEHLRALADHVIDLHVPALRGRADRYARLLEEASVRTARLMAAWQAVGFVHGVMNTDNFSILGLTLDYGPYAFMEGFVPGYAPNHSDPHGRYAYERQPGIGQWNVATLANAMVSLMDREQAQAALDAYVPAWERAYAGRMRTKLGLRELRQGDDDLLDGLLELLAADRADWTLAWRALGGVTVAGATDTRAFAALFTRREACDAWLATYRARLAAEGGDDLERRTRMDAVNPRFVLRTHLAQRAIDAAARDDASEIDRLLRILRRPFDEQPESAAYALPSPDGTGGSSLSCSS
ncbi:MAG TPA: YdiU family protein [Gemmatimonadales bacterium]|nr:YdiU family protein [Gemmatimonadales bacterium]